MYMRTTEKGINPSYRHTYEIWKALKSMMHSFRFGNLIHWKEHEREHEHCMSSDAHCTSLYFMKIPKFQI